MCGISGSGKTHYAGQLEKNSYIRLSSDGLIWEKAGPSLFKLPIDQQKLLFDQCRSELFRRLTTLLESGKKVVVDATNCKRTIRDEIRHLCAQANVKPVFVYCHAEKDELWQRLSNRKGDGPDDLLVSSEQLADYCKGFETPQDDENDFIFLDTGSNQKFLK